MKTLPKNQSKQDMAILSLTLRDVSCLQKHCQMTSLQIKNFKKRQNAIKPKWDCISIQEMMNEWRDNLTHFSHIYFRIRYIM